ncbi:uncharacterized protein LY89DRAFT_725816 [Mollisia scopiformis]|uniref:Uncharacterized protein n=1 Tax=Mollisia scopiformis TaxID=149040 RepID=A0A132B4H8_MOLSC|nr:uncharacterized protein LY89DRAFT_725816 [Mollisia scopiformis]KUJ07300.1 hypothetical protein LY89DRAFT_725816 [Mollisia scopiformis]
MTARQEAGCWQKCKKVETPEEDEWKRQQDMHGHGAACLTVLTGLRSCRMSAAGHKAEDVCQLMDHDPLPAASVPSTANIPIFHYFSGSIDGRGGAHINDRRTPEDGGSHGGFSRPVLDVLDCAERGVAWWRLRCNGQRAVGSGQWAVGSGQWAEPLADFLEPRGVLVAVVVVVAKVQIQTAKCKVQRASKNKNKNRRESIAQAREENTALKANSDPVFHAPHAPTDRSEALLGATPVTLKQPC